MSQSVRRAVVAEFVIGAAALVGLYVVAVEPVERELDEAERMSRALAAEERRVEQSTLEPEEARRRLRVFEQERARLASLGAPAQTEAGMMQRVTHLAAEAGVRIDLVQPEVSGPERGKPAGEAAAGGWRVSRRMSQTVSATGTYAAVVRFVESLERRTGLTRVREVIVSPVTVPGSNEVTATIRTEHVAIAAAEAGRAGGAEGQEGRP